MTPEEISHQLRGIADTENFEERSGVIVAEWESANIGVEAVEPILRFIEEYPSVDLGTPGHLVHFMESFYRDYKDEYEKSLLKSVSRKPTMHTVWMLNRLINGTKNLDERTRLIAAMLQAKDNPLTDTVTLNQTHHFLQRFGI